MTTTLTDKSEPAPGELRLALRPKEAAAALGISERLLWTMTKANEVPHVRFGRAIVYPVAKLREWLDAQASETQET